MGPKIVIVEDDSSVRKSFRLLLESAGFLAVDFDTPEAFIASEHYTDSDCIITDLIMPGVTGFDLIERLHSRGNVTPVIVVTAFGNPASRERARRLGVKAFFSKPIDDQALVDAIHWSIEGADDLRHQTTASTQR
jgi:FixJ family two-component response regulator